MKQPEQRLGSTRSGMIIRDDITDDTNELTNLTRNYGADEHFDAYALFQFLLMRELSKYGRESVRIKRYELHGRFHKDQLSVQASAYQMTALALTTIFDVANFGKSRADPIFHD
jgi:hypothetical protein